ncbi:unnamed protein product [Porites evermanni]|uniref:Uncharacterized protein n=1 Tax=Porites evermanni TaxID=104178 RepID=A0ABN8QC84_9CNID|nr:unnamed protein product [Porites evermanni]
MGCLDSLQPLHQECSQKHGKPGQARNNGHNTSLFAAFCLLQIEITVLFVANSQWNTLKTVCSGATRL